MTLGLERSFNFLDRRWMRGALDTRGFAEEDLGTDQRDVDSRLPGTTLSSAVGGGVLIKPGWPAICWEAFISTVQLLRSGCAVRIEGRDLQDTA